MRKMSKPVDQSQNNLRNESESSVRVLTPPPPESPIEISDSEMSIDYSGNQYGFIGFDETYPGKKFEAVGTVADGFQFNRVGRDLHAHPDYFVAGHSRFYLSSSIPIITNCGGSSTGVGCRYHVVVDRS